MKLLILGIDGLDWQLFHDFEPPFLSSLPAKGMLWSDIPLSPPAWTTIFTGCDVKRHKINNFTQPMLDSKVPLLWDVAGQHYSFGLFNVPMTFSVPMQRVNGWMVSGFPRPFPACYPDDLMAREVLAGANQKSGEEAKMANQEWLVRHFPALCRQYPVDVAATVIMILDEVGHGSQFNWKNSQDRLRKFYHMVDADAQAIYEELQPDVLLVLSDHGWNSAVNSDTLYKTETQIRQSAASRENYAYHTREGFIAFGGDVKAGPIEGAHTRDVTPTIYRLLGVRPSFELDGVALDVLPDLPAEDEAIIEARLAELGYIETGE